VNQEVSTKGKHCLNLSVMKKLRAIKKDVLRLFKTFFESTKDQVYVSVNFVPPLGELLKDHINSVTETRFEI
jgi:hypothetical protein